MVESAKLFDAHLYLSSSVIFDTFLSSGAALITLIPHDAHRNINIDPSKVFRE